jgi:hypothetical protein
VELARRQLTHHLVQPLGTGVTPMTSRRCSRFVSRLVLLVPFVGCQSVQTPEDDGKRWLTGGAIDSEIFAGEEPQVAVDAMGGAVAVWHQASHLGGPGDNVWSNRCCSSGGEWGTAELLETNDVGDALWPTVAVDPGGSGIAVWQQSDGTRSSIWANRFTPSGGWGSAELIEADDAGDAVRPRVAVDSKGNAIAVWQQNDGTLENIWSNSYTPGVGWGSPELVETDDAGDALGPRVAVSPSGDAVAVWHQARSSRSIIFASRTQFGGSWGPPRPIDDVNSSDAKWPFIAIDSSGNATAVWKVLWDADHYGVWSNRSGPNDVWEEARPIKDDLSGVGSPRVAMDSNGNAIAVWRQRFDATRSNVWASRSAAKGDWESAALIGAENAGGAGPPRLAIDPSGNALAVWTSVGVWFNRYTPSGGWGRPQPIQADNNGGSSRPDIAMDLNGDVTGVWRYDDGDPAFSIWANRFTDPQSGTR